MRRTLAVVGLILALVVAGCGDGEMRAKPQSTDTSTIEPCATKVKVYATADRIPKGMTGDIAFAQGLIAQREIDPAYRPATAVLDPALVDGKAAVADLEPNTVVTGSMFGITVPDASISCDRRPD